MNRPKPQRPPKPEPRRPKFEVKAVQNVVVTFPKSVHNSYAGIAQDFSKTLTADEARLLASLVNTAADEISKGT